MYYYPTELDELQECYIRFVNDYVGEVNFLVSGKGVKPSEMETMTVSCKINGSFSAVVNYKNPFNKRVMIDLDIETQNPETWKLIAKKRNMYLEPLAWVQIPVNFLPTVIGKT